MADETPATAAPEAAEPSLTPGEAKPTEDSAPEAPKEKEGTNGSEEKPSDNVTTSEDKKEEVGPASEKADAPAKSTDAKESGAATAPAEAEAAPEPEANGTPASAKKSSSSKRKSTGGSGSKLSRKKSQTRITHLHAKPGEYYLARLRSFPPWPSIICDEEILPQSLLTTRPVSAARPDGSYRDDYADDGKRAHERTFPVMFFQTNEFAWIPNTDLTPIDAAACKEVSPKNKGKLLLAAYAVAAEGHDLQYFKELLADHQRALEQEEEEREAQAAAKAAAKAEKDAKKNKRKSMEIADDEDVDMEDADTAKKSKSSKKRKKDAEDEDEKPAKTPKTGTKLKLTTPKTPASEKKTPASKAKQSASTKKSNKGAASDEGEEGTPAEVKEPAKQVSQEEAKVKKEKEILFVRHKLQKGFISRDQPPKEEEMTTMDTYFTKLEKHSELEVSIIRSTKINKVLKMIVKLSSIPRDEEFQFRQRAITLLSKWKSVLDAEAPAEDKGDKLKANGLQKEESVDTPAPAELEGEKEEESKTAASAEPQDEKMTDADAAEPAKEDAEKTAPKTEAPAAAEKPVEEKTSDEKPAEEKAAEATA
ncbi:hypothetical protein BJX96DRAFT_154248 [Aspergillus floccosus]